MHIDSFRKRSADIKKLMNDLTRQWIEKAEAELEKQYKPWPPKSEQKCGNCRFYIKSALVCHIKDKNSTRTIKHLVKENYHCEAWQPRPQPEHPKYRDDGEVKL